MLVEGALLRCWVLQYARFFLWSIQDSAVMVFGHEGSEFSWRLWQARYSEMWGRS